MRKPGVRKAVVCLLAVACFVGAGAANAQKAKKPAEWKVAGTKSGFVTTTDGAKIHYVEAGQTRTTGNFQIGGTPPPDAVSKGQVVFSGMRRQPSILFVAGWTMPAEIWEKQIEHFAKTHRVVAMDPRGQGKSSKPDEGYHPTTRARDIHDVVTQLKLEPVVLVGWSMGVMEVTSYVGQFWTQGIAGIVLVDGLAGGDFPPQAMKAFLGWAGSFAKDRAKANDGFVRSMYKKPQTEEYIERVKAAARETPTAAAMALILGMISSDNRSVLPKIDRPTLIVMAPGGPWDAVYVEMQKAIPGARLEKFEGAGHALFVDEAEKFNAVLEEFVRGLANTTGR